MVVTKTSRYKNSYISVNRTEKFRDTLIVFGKKIAQTVFLSTFNNSYRTYEIITIPVSNGTYKIKVTSSDNFGNENLGTEGTVIVSFYPLPPVNVTAEADTIILNRITLNWEHSVEGAPDTYNVYSNNGAGNVVDKSAPLVTVLGSVLTYVHATPSNGLWRYIVEAVDTGIESNSYNIAEATVPYTDEIPQKPGPGGLLSATGVSLENVSIGKVKLNFLWIYDDQAASFNVYYDNGTGTINYLTPLMNITRLDQLVQTGTTGRLHLTNEDITYGFVVRAVSQNGVEETNADIYSIVVDGKEPDNAIGLSLDTVY